MPLTRSKSTMSTAPNTRTTNTSTTTSTTIPIVPPSQIPLLQPPIEPNLNQMMRGVNYPRIRMPVLVNTNVEAWFKSMEYWFRASGIYDDNQRNETILASIDPNVLDQLTDQLERVPDVGKYEYSKRILISHFADSEQRKLNRLLSEMPLGDKRPSELYHEMKQVAGNVLGETALKGLWAQRLPEAARPVIAATTGTSAEFTKMADTIVDALAPRTVRQVTTEPLNEISELKAIIAELRSQINKIPHRSRSKSRSEPNQRNHTPANNGANANANNDADPNLCWYHQVYGRDAKKCRSPCRNRTRSQTPTASTSTNPPA